MEKGSFCAGIERRGPNRVIGAAICHNQRMSIARLGLPDLGIGVGLRVPHYRHILEEQPPMDFFEIISENFMVEGGKPLYHLERVMERYPLIQHGVSLAIGGPQAPNKEYLRKLKRLVRKVNPAWLSDHFCWGGIPGHDLHDLLPLPYTWAAVKRVTERARMVQDFLEVPFALENTSSYMAYRQSEMTEWQFVSEVCERANIGLMFDVNNVFVSAFNHGFDPMTFIENVPHARVVQIHLAGHTHLGKYIIDTHRGPIIDPVWDLYRETIRLTGSVSTLIEWDDAVPAWAELAAEVDRARRVRAEALDTPMGANLTPAAPAKIDLGARQTSPYCPAESGPASYFASAGHHGGPRESAGQESTTLGASVNE